MIKIDGISVGNYENIINGDCPSFSGIVTGENKGNLWVDNIERPKIAITDSYAVGGFAFLGIIDSEDEYMKLKNYVSNDIFNFLQQNGKGYFEYSVESDDLKPYIQKMFEDKVIQSEKEYSFRIIESNNKNHSLPEGFKMQIVDFDLWDKVIDGDLINGLFLTKRLLESWESFDKFEKKGVGFCITYLDSIVAVIIGTARFNKIISIDIEIVDELKHKGLGYSLTIEFVNECMQRGIIPQWDCVESNPISRKLAEKAGFELFKENEVFWFEI